jgi:Tfp pilus assembly protein PilF
VSTLANILLSRGELGEARVLLETVAANGRAPAHVPVALAAIAYKEGRLDQARHHLECAVNADPDAVLARLYLARVLDCEGRPEEAGRQLAAALAVAPALAETRGRIAAHELRGRAEARFQAGDAPGALDLLVQALRLDAEDPLIHNDLGVVLHALGEPLRARECFERALQLTAALRDAADNLRQL